ncbi:hypothetical protein SDC9_162895 [bioreactor metagenome]|uniref:Uncharacterized protein n=1 Tax=bioreactor metagenome TaxID=1076179 RepID=A0A645FME3_9ZZZZ
MSRLRKYHPPLSPQKPIFTKAPSRRLRLVITRKSQARARALPAPAAAPLIRATTGLAHRRTAAVIRPVSRTPVSGRPPPCSKRASNRLTSPPAQKFFPAPVRTTARTSLAREQYSIQSPTAWNISWVKALLASGRLRVTVAIWFSSTEKRTWGVLLTSIAAASTFICPGMRGSAFPGRR